MTRSEIFNLTDYVIDLKQIVNLIVELIKLLTKRIKEH